MENGVWWLFMPERKVTNIIFQWIDYRPVDSIRKGTCSILFSLIWGTAEGKGKQTSAFTLRSGPKLQLIKPAYLFFCIIKMQTSDSTDPRSALSKTKKQKFM